VKTKRAILAAAAEVPSVKAPWTHNTDAARDAARSILLYNVFMTEKTTDESKNERGHWTTFHFESSVDKQIREAMERGDFDHLKNQGKPLNLARDPNVPEDWEMAFNLLKNAGYAPDWIETRAQIDREQEKLFAPLRRYLAAPPASKAERAHARNKILAQFRAHATELNRLIDTYNLKAPSPQVHLRRIRIEDEIAKFLQACERAH
jgi:DnaJ family protein C protein 28